MNSGGQGMSEIGKIRFRIPKNIKRGQIIPVKVLIRHPMETGFRKDKATGETIPAYYINRVEIYYSGELITLFDWTRAISANPLITFYLRADKNAPLRIVWKDNKGGVYEKSVMINPQ